MWVLIFCASKAPELLDTVFLVLRKKPVIVLHWSARCCPVQLVSSSAGFAPTSPAFFPS